jgi:GH25 family lysozyme M1 (1,4-beta-N-acetylmuramidase)
MGRRLLVAAATALVLAPAASASVPGIDVSHYNGLIDWAGIAGAGYKFVFAKATEGNTLADAPYAAYRAGAGASNLKFGAYHFARPGGATTGAIRVDAVAEADHFVDVAQPRSGDLLPVLDLEVTGGLSPSSLRVWTWSWLREVEARLHVKAILYTSPHFWVTALANTTAFAAAGYRVLWIAHYTRASAPTVPAQNWGGHGWTFWQWTSCATVPGIFGCVDSDRYSGASFAPVTIPGPPRNTSPPTISGSAAPGLTLTASHGTWSGTPPLTYAYQWQRCDAAGANCASIAGATRQAYTVVPADIAQRLIVVVTARNAAGTASATSRPSALVGDTTPPTIPSFSKPAHPFQQQVRFSVGWSSTDTGTGVANYDIRYRSARYDGGFGVETAWRSATSATSAAFTGSPGTTYCFSARARDRAGNVSGWSAETCTALPVDDRTLAAAAGTWLRRSADGYYRRTYSTAARKGAALVLRGAQGRRLALLAARCPTCGTVQIFWNGTLLKQVSLAAPTLEKKQLVVLGSFPSRREGTVRMRVASSGRPVQIDGLAVSRG